MARTGRSSAEQLRRDLGAALNAFIKQGTSARRAAAHAKSQQTLPLTSTSFGFTLKHGVPEVHATVPTAAGDRFTAGHPRTASHVLPCRITQHGHQSIQPQVAPARSSSLAASAGIRPSPPHVLTRQSYSVPPLSDSDLIDGLQCEVVVSKQTYEQYGQAPPSKETSGGLLTANLQAAKADEVARSRDVSPADREVLYEKVAQRLDEIATEINSKYFPEYGDQPAQRQLSSAVLELVQEVSTTSFNNAVSRVIPNTQPEMQQLALLYQLTAAAIHVVGTGSSHASHLADLCVHYAFDRFAAFIMAKGGLDLAIGDSDFEVD